MYACSSRTRVLWLPTKSTIIIHNFVIQTKKSITKKYIHNYSFVKFASSSFNFLSQFIDPKNYLQQLQKYHLKEFVFLAFVVFFSIHLFSITLHTFRHNLFFVNSCNFCTESWITYDKKRTITNQFWQITWIEDCSFIELYHSQSSLNAHFLGPFTVMPRGTQRNSNIHSSTKV